jgi:hypothetical protein
MPAHLKTAVRVGTKIYVGQRDENHDHIKTRHGLHVRNDSQHGFIPSDNERMWLSRSQAMSWLRRFEPDIYAKVHRKIPAEGLHSHIYAAAKGIVMRVTADERENGFPLQEGEMREESVIIPPVDLSKMTAIVYDRGGLYLYCAEKLAEKYGNVMYYLADADAYPTSQKNTIGMGIPKVKRIHDLWEHIDEADCLYFFDCYDGELQHWLRHKGYKVFGSGRAEQLEINKTMFMDKLKELKLPAAETYIAHGMKELREHLTKHDNTTLFLKNLHRGDFESKKFSSMVQIRPWLDDLVKRVGTASDTMDVLVQNKIEAVAEIGYDGFCIDGEYTENCIVGYEIKDICFVGKIFLKTPKILADINAAFAPAQKELGGRGNLSTEIRQTKDGKSYYIDPTERVPSPPGEVICEVYEDWAEDTYRIACGEVPVLKPQGKFIAELVLTSEWYGDHELHVTFPKKYRQHVKLKNHTVRDGEFYCIPNGNGNFFGAVVAYADTLKEAVDKVKEVAESVEADDYKYDPSGFDEATEAVKAGEQFGIVF